MQSEMTLQDAVNSVRAGIKKDGAYLIELKKAISSSDTLPNEDRGEVLANITLAYRHLEDASMRLGKVIQARDGGISVYDKETTIGVTTK